jgi:transposase
MEPIVSGKTREEYEGKVGNKAKMVVINNIEYPSITLAAEAFDLSVNTIINRIKSDKPEFCGYKYKDVNTIKVVIVNGKEYSTVDEAAEKTGMHKTTIYKKIKSGEPKDLQFYFLEKEHN